MTTNTEVTIAPKLSRNKQISSNQKLNGTSDSSAANVPASGIVSESPELASQTLRVLPLRIVPPVLFPKSSGSELLAFVSPNTFSRLYPSRNEDRDSWALQFWKTNIKCLTPPVDPSSPTLPTSVSPDLAIRPQNPGGGEMGFDKINKTGTTNDDVFIGITKQLPANHVVFLNLPDGVEEWDLLRFV